MVLTSLILLIANPAAPQELPELDMARAAISKIAPGRELIAIPLVKYAKASHIDWKAMAAILFQESSFRTDPQNCLNKQLNCSDFGISQINWKTWGKVLNLDKKRLVTDASYNIKIMSIILMRLKADYGSEKHWITRFHSFNPKNRTIYAGYIYPKYKRLNVLAREYVRKK